MQTLTSTALEFRHDDTEVIIYRDGQNVGRIAFNIEANRWEFNAYGQSVSAVGTLEQCQDAATDELMLKPEPQADEPCLAKVVSKGAVSRPSSYYSDYRYISRNQVQRITIGGLDGSWKDELWVPLGLVNKLRVGSIVVPYRPDGPYGELCLKWPSRPVRRSAIAA